MPDRATTVSGAPQDYRAIRKRAEEAAFRLGEEIIADLGGGVDITLSVYQGFAQLVAPWMSLLKDAELRSERALAAKIETIVAAIPPGVADDGGEAVHTGQLRDELLP